MMLISGEIVGEHERDMDGKSAPVFLIVIESESCSEPQETIHEDTLRLQFCNILNCNEFAT